MHTHKWGESYSLLFLHFVGGSEVIKQVAVHLHEGLQHIVDQRHDGPGEGKMGLEIKRKRKPVHSIFQTSNDMWFIHHKETFREPNPTPNKLGKKTNIE